MCVHVYCTCSDAAKLCSTIAICPCTYLLQQYRCSDANGILQCTQVVGVCQFYHLETIASLHGTYPAISLQRKRTQLNVFFEEKVKEKVNLQVHVLAYDAPPTAVQIRIV